MDFRKLFDSMFPGFFNNATIQSMPEDRIFTELIMHLQRDTPPIVPVSCPTGITFGMFRGDNERLKEAVDQVDQEWFQYFSAQSRIFCAFDRDIIVSFCVLDEWGTFDDLRIGGPGCVGTIPAYRKQGIGLEMVRLATSILKAEGFDLSWIHYTHIGHWYEKLGYQSVLQWNCRGITSRSETP